MISRFFLFPSIVTASLAAASAQPVRHAPCTQLISKTITLTPTGGVLAAPGSDLAVALRLSTTALEEACTPITGRLTNLILDFGDGTTEPPFAGSVEGMVGTAELTQTFSHAYASPGAYTVRLRGIERYGAGASFDFAVSANVVVLDPPRVPAVFTLTRLAALNSPSVDWSPRLVNGGAGILFLSERGGRSALYGSQRTAQATYDPPTEVTFTSGSPGPIAGFDVSTDGLTIVARAVPDIGPGGRGTGDFYRATRATTTAPFGSLSRLTFRADSIVLPPAPAAAGNEFRAARHVGLRSDGGLLLPSYLIFPGGTDSSYHGKLCLLTPSVENTFDHVPGPVAPDALPRLQSSNGSLRLWTVADATGSPADGEIYALQDGPAVGQSVYDQPPAARTEAKLGFTALEAALGGATSFDLGGVAPEGNFALLSATTPGSTTEEDLFEVGF